MPTATVGEARIEIDAPPLAVYALVSDITRIGAWSPECYRCEWLHGATTAVEGARFRGHNRLGKVGWHTDAVVTVADPGRGVCVYDAADPLDRVVGAWVTAGRVAGHCHGITGAAGPQVGTLEGRRTIRRPDIEHNQPRHRLHPFPE